MRSFFPSVEFFSISSTLAPSSAARPAAIMPAGPPPITATSQIVSESFIVDILTLIKRKRPTFPPGASQSTSLVEFPALWVLNADLVSFLYRQTETRYRVVDWLLIQPKAHIANLKSFCLSCHEDIANAIAGRNLEQHGR